MKTWIKPLLKVVIPIVVILVLFRIGKWYGMAAIAALLVYLAFKLRINMWIYKANSLFAKKDFAGAAEHFGKAYGASKKPSYAISQAFVLLKNGQVREAEQLLTEMMKLKLPRTEEMNAKINYSLALWLLGQQEQALKLMEAVFSDFKNSIGYGNLGMFYVMSGDLDRALSFNLEAYEYNDSDKTILDNLAYTYYLLGRHQEAKEIYEKLMEQKPTFAEAFYYYGLTLRELGEIDQSIQIMQQGLEFEPSMMTNVTKAMLNEKLGEWNMDSVTTSDRNPQ
ncbi:tetratricopeptide repeat protein [Paenibacillus cremeus]|uniref:Tetratricopeptide repeat protein n=1 Tax=Paenibacillus cremeus TaxID=2163881 RepID=A0A559KFY8_9BACL|nr:tetratricopeptide repeat protein [Paenibacillus cremeus]TVY11042.1 tetratricopeptide repeat protein [Paenibacillus cremeus]